MEAARCELPPFEWPTSKRASAASVSQPEASNSNESLSRAHTRFNFLIYFPIN